ncbi:MAG: DNA-protecting protein DprA [Solirubrobacteraceae bacterium MAG38_C4-C5]|nr:DNA-protecting protein DprA [Candidatus Siliceabacter maunaloa]
MRTSTLTRGQVVELLETEGSALRALEAADPGEGRLFDPDDGGAVDLEAIEAELEGWSRQGIAVQTALDDEYPANLQTVHDRPPALFVRGKLAGDDQRSVAVVGTRSPTHSGLDQAGAVARGLVDAGYVVVSGLAAGIDTAAHTAALEAGGRTVAMLGTGLRHVFPKENAELQRLLGEESAVISHLWPDQGPRRWTFPERNAVMSGFAQATIVIEASQTSGARMQARLALEHGRPVFLMRSLLAHPWAQRYADRPGVHVIDAVDEVIPVLERVYSSELSLIE